MNIMLYDFLVVRQITTSNPAHAVRGPKYVVKKGKTPVWSREDAKNIVGFNSQGFGVRLTGPGAHRLGEAYHRLVTVSWARSCNPRRTAVPIRILKPVRCHEVKFPSSTSTFVSTTKLQQIPVEGSRGSLLSGIVHPGKPSAGRD